MRYVDFVVAESMSTKSENVKKSCDTLNLEK